MTGCGGGAPVPGADSFHMSFPTVISERRTDRRRHSASKVDGYGYGYGYIQSERSMNAGSRAMWLP